MGDTLGIEKPYLRLAGMITGNLGSLSDEVVKHFLDNAVEIPEALVRGFVLPVITPVEKFALLADLGIITVPANYDHATRLDSFRKNNWEKFYSYNDELTDTNFGNPSRVMKPGDRFRVKVFKQTVGGTTTSEERLAFLKSQNAVLTGAQGASLVFGEERGHLPKGYWHSSFDEKDRLWKSVAGYHRVPSIDARSSGYFDFRLGHFESVWDDSHTVLCFCFCDEADAKAE